MSNFNNSTLSTQIAHQDTPFSLIEAVQKITGDGAITIKSGIVYLTKGTAAAITIAAPDQDGQVITIIAGSGVQHQVTQATDGFNAKGSSGTITLGGALGDSAIIKSVAGYWWRVAGTNATVA